VIANDADLEPKEWTILTAIGGNRNVDAFRDRRATVTGIFRTKTVAPKQLVNQEPKIWLLGPICPGG
jgi:hypothetical protein